MDTQTEITKKSSSKKKTGQYTVKIGDFQQISDKMFVSDPLFDYEPKEHEPNSFLWKLNMVIENVLPGCYQVVLLINKNEKYRNAVLVCMHQSMEDSEKKINQYEWKKIGTIGVDSGQAGIYDLKHYRDDSIISDNNDETSKETSDKWYQMNCDLTIKPTDFAGAISHGAVSRSGHGDGMYDVSIVKNDDDKVVMVKIFFIEECPTQLDDR